MTVIEVTSSPPNSKKAELDRGMNNGDMPPPISPPAKGVSGNLHKKVTFKAPAPAEGLPKQHEKDVISRVEEILPSTSHDSILRILRKIPINRQRNMDDVISEIVDNLLNSPQEDEPKPVQGCAERPAQTDPTGMPQLEAHFQIPMALPITEFPTSSSSNEQSDIQQAIQLSLQTENERRGYHSTIPENPEELSRVNLPVGIYNVGQTCWFNVIVQVLYNLPRYRKLIYHRTPQNWINNEQSLTPEQRFLVEMRKLFAQLDAGNKRVVDPTDAMRALEVEFGSALLGHQNDASEMRDRVIGVITRALRQADEAKQREPLEIELPSSSSDKMDMSPAVSTITLHEPMQTEELSTNAIDDIMMLPTQPNFPKASKIQKEDVWEESPFQELFHYRRVKRRVGIDGVATNFDEPALTDMPTITCDVQKPSLHDAIEHYFIDDKTETYVETLPEVFFVSLNRFCYKNETGTSKIHTELSIPQNIFMDRYMHRNYDMVKEIQRTREGLRHELAEYIARCNGFDNFGYSQPGKNGSLLEILEATRLFCFGGTAHSRTNDTILPTTRVHLPREKAAEFADIFHQITRDAADQKQECYQRKNDLINSLAELFEIQQLQQEEYLLHSIIIHEGEADRGHYWTYVRCDPNSAHRNLWQKFNDSGVEYVTWEQVATEAKGNLNGRPGVSAYALCFVKAISVNLLSDEAETREQRVGGMPDDLRNYLTFYNLKFEEDIRKYKKAKEPSPPPVPQYTPKAHYTIYDEKNIHQRISFPWDSIYLQDMKHRNKNYSRAQIMREHAEKCRKNIMTEYNDWENNLFQMNNCRFKYVLKEKFSNFLDESYRLRDDCTDLQLTEIYETLIRAPFDCYMNRYELSNPDPRIEPLSWWFSTGLGMSAATYRFIALKALSFSKIRIISDMASKELREQDKSCEIRCVELEEFYSRFNAHYCLLKQLIYVVRCVMEECTATNNFNKFQDDTINGYFEQWVNNLLRGHLVLRLYNTIKEDLEHFAWQLGSSIKVEDVVMPLLIIRMTIIYPLLKFWRYVLHFLMMARSSTDVLKRLNEHGVYDLTCLSLNMIAKWGAEGDNLCAKIAESQREVLSMCKAMIPESSESFTLTENYMHALKRETTIISNEPLVHDINVQLVEGELKEISRMRLLIGFSDEQDAFITVTRLLEEAAMVFNMEFH